jgi:hypothetical protein
VILITVLAERGIPNPFIYNSSVLSRFIIFPNAEREASLIFLMDGNDKHPELKGRD